jgi:hypothetical protein
LVIHDVALGMFGRTMARRSAWYPRDALYRTLRAVSFVAPHVLNVHQCSALLGQCVMDVMNGLEENLEGLVSQMDSAFQCMQSVCSAEGFRRALPPHTTMAFPFFKVLRLIDAVNNFSRGAEAKGAQSQLFGQVDDALNSSAGVLGRLLRLDPDVAFVATLADRLENDADSRAVGRGSRTVAYSQVLIARQIAMRVQSFPGVYERIVPLLVRVACESADLVLLGPQQSQPEGQRVAEAAMDVLFVLVKHPCSEIRQLLRIASSIVIALALQAQRTLISANLKGWNVVSATADAIATAALFLTDALRANSAIAESVLHAVLAALPYFNGGDFASKCVAAIDAIVTLLEALESDNPQQHVALRRSVAQAAMKNRHAKKHVKRLRAVCRIKTQPDSATVSLDTKRTRRESH